MSDRTVRNQAFLRNLFGKGPFEGHGFVCQPVRPNWPETRLVFVVSVPDADTGRQWLDRVRAIAATTSPRSV